MAADAVAGASKTNGHSNNYPSAYAAKYNLAAHFIGGNELSRAAPSKVKEFVAQHDGHTVITKVSAANSEAGNRGLFWAKAGDGTDRIDRF